MHIRCIAVAAFCVCAIGSANAQVHSPEDYLKMFTCVGGIVAGTCQEESGPAVSVEETPQGDIILNGQIFQKCQYTEDATKVVLIPWNPPADKAKCPTGGYNLGGVQSTRGAVVRDISAIRPTTPPAAAPVAPPQPMKNDLFLTFQTDSANLTEVGATNARNFATALKFPKLAQARFEIQGHTDKSGTHEYNLALSNRRAEAVKAFLVGQGIDPDRLVAKGYSYDEPISSDPLAAENRRVVALRLQ